MAQALEKSGALPRNPCIYIATSNRMPKFGLKNKDI